MKSLRFFTLLLIFTSNLSLNAQCDLNYEYSNTGSNMTIALPNSSIETIHSLGDGNIGVFHINVDGSLSCFGSIFISGEELAFPAMANDETTPYQDGFANNQEMIWMFIRKKLFKNIYF